MCIRDSPKGCCNAIDADPEMWQVLSNPSRSVQTFQEDVEVQGGDGLGPTVVNDNICMVSTSSATVRMPEL